jgi:multiple sugar transport system ATP-binding protein
MTGISTTGLRKEFDDVTAVDGVDLTVNEGEFLVLVGPSGCGKSTTLRLVAGLETPTDGRIEIADRDVTGDEPPDRDVAMVFQNYALYPHMSARRNMTFGVTDAGDIAADEIEQRVSEAARILEITDLLDRKPGALSGGEKQRVAIGRALVRDPEVFLMDEPLSNLDAKLRLQMRAELARLHNRLATTTVYVTHDQVEAMTLGDRVAVMNAGEIEQVARPQQLYDYPATTFVAEFIGNPAMNTVDAEVTGVGDDVCVTWADVSVPLPVARGAVEPVDRQTVFGIRPEDLVLDSDGPLTLDVEVTEPLGDTLLARGTIGGESFEVQLEPRSGVTPGTAVSLDVDPDRLHLFDPETGQALYHSDTESPDSSDSSRDAAAEHAIGDGLR